MAVPGATVKPVQIEAAEGVGNGVTAQEPKAEAVAGD